MTIQNYLIQCYGYSEEDAAKMTRELAQNQPGDYAVTLKEARQWAIIEERFENINRHEGD